MTDLQEADISRGKPTPPSLLLLLNENITTMIDTSGHLDIQRHMGRGECIYPIGLPVEKCGVGMLSFHRGLCLRLGIHGTCFDEPLAKDWPLTIFLAPRTCPSRVWTGGTNYQLAGYGKLSIQI